MHAWHGGWHVVDHWSSLNFHNIAAQSSHLTRRSFPPLLTSHDTSRDHGRYRAHCRSFVTASRDSVRRRLPGLAWRARPLSGRRGDRPTAYSRVPGYTACCQARRDSLTYPGRSNAHRPRFTFFRGDILTLMMRTTTVKFKRTIFFITLVTNKYVHVVM